MKRRDTVCAHLHFNVCKEIGVKLENKHRYDRVPKLVETSHEGKITNYGTNKCEPQNCY